MVNRSRRTATAADIRSLPVVYWTMEQVYRDRGSGRYRPCVNGNSAPERRSRTGLSVAPRDDPVLVSKDMERVTGSKRVEVPYRQNHEPTVVKVKNELTARRSPRTTPGAIAVALPSRNGVEIITRNVMNQRAASVPVERSHPLFHSRFHCSYREARSRRR